MRFRLSQFPLAPKQVQELLGRGGGRSESYSVLSWHLNKFRSKRERGWEDRESELPSSPLAPKQVHELKGEAVDERQSYSLPPSI